VWKAGDDFWQKSSPLVTTLITRESERCRVRAVFYDCRTRETGGASANKTCTFPHAGCQRLSKGP